MKKTIGIIAMLLVTLVMLTGCVNINYEVDVNKNGSGEISYIYAFSKESLKSLQVSAEDMVSSMKEQAEKSEYKTEVYEDDEYSVFKASKHVNNLETEFSFQEAFGEDYVKENENNKENGIKITNNLFKTKVSQNAEIDLTSMKDITSVVTMKYTVKLPVKIKSNNATEVNGKTLTWNLVGGEVNKIEFTASSINVLPVLVIIIVVIGAAVVCYFVFFNKKNNKETEEKNKETK